MPAIHGSRQLRGSFFFCGCVTKEGVVQVFVFLGRAGRPEPPSAGVQSWKKCIALYVLLYLCQMDGRALWESHRLLIYLQSYHLLISRTHAKIEGSDQSAKLFFFLASVASISLALKIGHADTLPLPTDKMRHTICSRGSSYYLASTNHKDHFWPFGSTFRAKLGQGTFKAWIYLYAFLTCSCLPSLPAVYRVYSSMLLPHMFCCTMQS